MLLGLPFVDSNNPFLQTMWCFYWSVYRFLLEVLAISMPGVNLPLDSGVEALKGVPRVLQLCRRLMSWRCLFEGPLGSSAQPNRPFLLLTEQASPTRWDQGTLPCVQSGLLSPGLAPSLHLFTASVRCRWHLMLQSDGNWRT